MNVILFFFENLSYHPRVFQSISNIIFSPVFEESIWSQNAHLLFYRRPNTRYLQFYTLDPLELDLSKHKPTQFAVTDDTTALSSEQQQYRDALEGHARKNVIQNE